MKTSDLTGAALDWAVARCENAGAAMIETHSRGRVLLLADATEYNEPGETYNPSTDWAQGGPIIERERIRLETNDHPDLWPWFATKLLRWEKREDEEMGDWPVYAEGGGDTPLIAAMRCYVASKLGDEVEVPTELMEAA